MRRESDRQDPSAGGASRSSGASSKGSDLKDDALARPRYLCTASSTSTNKHFIHGQDVGLGIYLGSELQENDSEATLETLRRTGVDIRPEAMGIS